VDLSTAPALRARIGQLVADDVRHLIVSLERVGFLDSSGLSALVSAMKDLEASGGSLALICRDEAILKVFTVTGLDRVFTIHDSLADAVGA
jgi:anti-sigma B factor antagonist